MKPMTRNHRGNRNAIISALSRKNDRTHKVVLIASDAADRYNATLLAILATEQVTATTPTKAIVGFQLLNEDSGIYGETIPANLANFEMNGRDLDCGFVRAVFAD